MSDPRDLLQRIARVGAEIDPALTDRDVERLVTGARARARRRRLARGVLIVAAGGIATMIAFALRPIDGARAHAPTLATVPAASVVPAPDRPPMSSVPLRLADGSVATPLDSASAIALRENSERQVTVDLVRGRGRFDVAPRAERQFSVRAGDVTITVLGTLFTVERVADRIGVGVERGRVLVEWATGSRRLDVGESGWFPPLATTEPVPVARKRHVPAHRIAEAAPASTEPAPAMPAPIPPAPAAQPAPFTPAAPAPRLPAAPARDEETAETLLAAADAARLDGRALDGAALLRRVLTQHRADPRAPLAAFTLGRMLLMDLGQPRDAAAAFAEARALAPSGPFAEDALAREVEALAKAGDAAAAQARGRDYLRLYPNGRRATAVRVLGGGE